MSIYLREVYQNNDMYDTYTQFFFIKNTKSTR